MSGEIQNVTQEEFKKINDLFMNGMVSREYLWKRMLFGEDVSDIMPYKKAFAELTRRKKTLPDSDHRIIKVNAGQYQVTSEYKGQYIDQLETRNMFMKTERPTFPPAQSIGPYTTEIFPYFRPQS